MQENIIWNSLFRDASPKATTAASPKTPVFKVTGTGTKSPSMLTAPTTLKKPATPTMGELLDASLPVYDLLEKSGFEPIEELGRGAFGSVWRARYQEKEFAIKKFNVKRQEARNAFVRELAVQMFIEKTSKRFCQSAAVCGKTAFIVKNDNQNAAVIVYPFVVAGDLAHLIENWSEKATLNIERLDTEAKRNAQQVLDLSNLIQLGVDFLRNIVEMHKNGIAHRDIKPENVLIHQKKREHSVFIDFGSACFVSYSDAFQQQLNHLFDRVEKQIGSVDRDLSCVPVDTTLLYIDPELAAIDAVGDKQKDFELGKQADLFAAAVVLFELFLEKRAITLIKSRNPIALIQWRPDTTLLLEKAATTPLLRKTYGRLKMLLDSMLAKDDSIDVYAEQLANIGELLLKN